jgi:phosphatidylglycerophosphate synthase
MTSTTTTSSTTTTATGATLGERLRRMRSKRNQDWWSIVFGGPVATFLAAVVADVTWVTPNRLTWLAFVCKLGAVPLIIVGAGAGGAPADLAAVVLLQLNAVLDCMDGVLARYRRAASVFGAFLDKVTDAIGLLAIMGAFGWRVRHETGDGAALVLCLVAAMLWITRLYAYWVVAFYEKEKRMPAPQAAAETRRDFGDLGLGERLRYYLASTYRVFFFAEADAFFWLGLALVTGWLRPIAWIYGVGLAAWSLGIVIHWTVRARAIDAWARGGGRQP